MPRSINPERFEYGIISTIEFHHSNSSLKSHHWAKYTANNVTLASLERETNRKRSRGWVDGEGESERWAPDGLAGREVVAMAHRRAEVPTELVSQHHLWRAALRSPCSLHTHSTPAALCNSPLSFSFFQSAFFTFMLLYSDFTLSGTDL